MKKNTYFTILLFTLLMSSSFSQGYYFNIGKNFTKYDYKNSQGQRNNNLKSDSGIMVDFGYQWALTNDEKLQYKAGISYQQFNNLGKNSIYNYSWISNYLGIQNSFSVALYTSNNREAFIKLVTGLSALKIINGKQLINNIEYDLTKEAEFKGLFIQPNIGLENEFYINELIQIGLGYRLSKAFNISNNSTEKLSFDNNTIYVNFKYYILRD